MGRPQGPRVIKQCPECEQGFEQLPADDRRGRIYCSRRCYQSARQPNGGRSDGLWTCTKCQEIKPVDEFHARRRDGRPASWCKPCTRDNSRQWIAANPGRQREYNLRTKFGLTMAEVDDMVAGQGGKCLGCERALPLGKGRHLDHRHADGKVRGVLCSNCNMAIGLLHDRADTFDRLAAYLRR